MTTRRTLGVGAATLFLVGALTACFPTLPGGPGTPGGGTADLSGTWSGTDSDGDPWGLEFQDDKTLGVTFRGEAFDEPADTWSLSGTALSITVSGFENGSITCEGPVESSSIPLTCNYAGRPFTLTLTRD